MRNLTTIFLGLLLVVFVFSGCQESEDLLDIKFPADYETELNVTVIPEKGTNGTFTVHETIDPNSDSDFAKYTSTIKDINIKEVSGLILSINPDVTLVSASLVVFNEKHSATWTFTNKQLSEGTVLTLDNDAGQWDTVEDILMDKTIFTVSLVGQTTEDNAEFVVLVKFKSDVTANPLN